MSVETGFHDLDLLVRAYQRSTAVSSDPAVFAMYCLLARATEHCRQARETIMGS